MTATIASRFSALLPQSLRRVPATDRSLRTTQTAGTSRGGWLQGLLRVAVRSRRNDAVAGIELLDKISLGGKKALLLVTAGGRELLVGIGEDGPLSISVLRTVSPARSDSSRAQPKQQGRRRARQRSTR